MENIVIRGAEMWETYEENNMSHENGLLDKGSCSLKLQDRVKNEVIRKIMRLCTSTNDKIDTK